MGRRTSLDLSQRRARAPRRRRRRRPRQRPARQAPRRRALEPALGDLPSPPRPRRGRHDRRRMVVCVDCTRHRAPHWSRPRGERLSPRARRRRRAPLTRRRPLRPVARRAADERRTRAVSHGDRRRAAHAREPAGILARNDVSLRAKEGLGNDVELLHGTVPDEIEVHEHGVRYLAAPWRGQKTGAFLDQRENRALVGRIARGRALDCFSYHGSFALHPRAARRSRHRARCVRARAHARRRKLSAQWTHERRVRRGERVRVSEGEGARARPQFDTIVLDPPAFAKTRHSLDAALRGYKEINLRAMRLLSPGGLLFTASCSFHLSKPLFLEMLEEAAADSGRRIVPAGDSRTAARSSGVADRAGDRATSKGRCSRRSTTLQSTRTGSMRVPSFDASRH